MKTFNMLGVAMLLATSTFAQKTDGTVKSLVEADREFATQVKANGQRSGFLANSDDNTILFRPNPVNAKTYYATRNENGSELIWEPSFATVAKSGDWGYTTGYYTAGGKDKTFGSYVSVWHAGKDGKWKLALDLGVSHPKAKSKADPVFVDPTNRIYQKTVGEQNLKIRNELILTTEKTLSTTLRTYGSLAYNDFLSKNARLLIEGYEPIIGKENIRQFIGKHFEKVSLKPVVANRAYSGEFAYTYGTATINNRGIKQSYNCVTIWALEDGFNWNIALQIFTPADR